MPPEPQPPSSSGFIDATTMARECAALTRQEQVLATSNRRYEFAPWGPSAIAIDGVVRATVSSSQRAILGRGARFGLTLDPGIHRFEVQTCRSAGIAGFYLMQTPSAS